MRPSLRLTAAAVGLAIFSVSAINGQAQFNYTTNNGTITITKYTGPGGDVSIPSTIDGLPVTSIGDEAFSWCTNLTNVTIPSSVIFVGDWAFSECYSLTNATIPDSVTRIGHWAFHACGGLTSVLIPDSVTSIGDWAFSLCTSLTNITMGKGIGSIESYVFEYCASLTTVHFWGDAPSIGVSAFGNTQATVYYLPGTTGWGAFVERPAALWVLPNPVILNRSVGIQTNALGFRISWATNASVVVDASVDLTHLAWSPVSTNTLTDGWSDFSDPAWTNYPTRFYRVRSQ